MGGVTMGRAWQVAQLSRDRLTDTGASPLRAVGNETRRGGAGEGAA